MNFKDYTKNEFLAEYGHEYCPGEIELNEFPTCSRGDEEQCKRCWENAIKDIEFKNEVDVFKEHNLQLLDELRTAEEQYKMLKESRDNLKEQLLTQMEMYGIDKFENDRMSISYVKGSIGSKFDNTNFKKDYPDTYKKYTVPVMRAASIRFKVK